MSLVFDLSKDCLARLKNVVSSEKLLLHEEVALFQWKDELGRLRVWAKNVGAHQTGQFSLDYRLRDASHLKDQTLKLLKRITDVLSELSEVLDEPHDEVEAGKYHEEAGEWGASEDTTEITEIYRSLVKTITNLYQVSMAIRQPSQHDRFIEMTKRDAEPFRFWAAQHVSHKHPHADQFLIDRLGSAMAKQWAILKYRRKKQIKISHQMDNAEGEAYVKAFDDSSQLPLEAASSELPHAKTSPDEQEAIKVPVLPNEGANNTPFECPYCFFVITISDSRAWAHHVFRDLMPYMCVFPDCSTSYRSYESRREWYHHIQEKHTVGSGTNESYECCLCRQTLLPVLTFKRHVGRHLEDLALFVLSRTPQPKANLFGSDQSKGKESLDDSRSRLVSEPYVKEGLPLTGGEESIPQSCSESSNPWTEPESIDRETNSTQDSGPEQESYPREKEFTKASSEHSEGLNQISEGLHTGVRASVDELLVSRKRWTSEGLESNEATRLGDGGDPCLLGALTNKAQTWTRVGVVNGEMP
jgi:hypothetical protein